MYLEATRPLLGCARWEGLRLDRPPASAPTKGLMGTTQRTWVDRSTRLVRRTFAVAQLPQIEQIHRLIDQLAESGVPMQRPLSEPVVSGERLTVDYEFCEDEPEDYEGQYYVPRERSARLQDAARVFATLQRAACRLEGPRQPLDYPFCNTLEWMYEEEPLVALAGGDGQLLEALRREKAWTALEEIVGYLMPLVKPVADRAAWGLCHGDYHSANTIFVGDQVGRVIDFGFWLHHPLPFDLAIALELWGRDYEAPGFALRRPIVDAFIEAYLKNGGPVDPSGEFVYFLPLSRLWIDMHRVRRLSLPKESDAARKALNEHVLPRLRWYMERLDTLLGG